MAITKEQLGILRHAENRVTRGFFCGDGSAIQGLVQSGLMARVGRKSLECFRITDAGRDALASASMAGKCGNWPASKATEQKGKD